jgi:preprotein translocase subunit SecY
MDEGQPQPAAQPTSAAPSTEPKKEKFSFNIDFASLAEMLPSITKPELKLNFSDKIKWTGIILLLFYLLGSITVWGISSTAVAQFAFLEIVFGSKMGSLLTLGIGPIVTASIILQLLVGSKVVNWDTKTTEGKRKFMGAQKILAILFCIFEAAAYVLAGAIPPAAGGAALAALVITQLALGGYLVMLMDEVVTKWGMGSGVSLFIAAGVAKTIMIRVFNPLTASGTLPTAEEGASGLIPGILTYIGAGQPQQAFILLFPIISTLAVFFIVVFAQAMRIEIPMAISFFGGKLGSRRWPIKFIYTSNIPVILTAAVLANLQAVAKMLAGKGITFFGAYDQQGNAIGGLVYYLTVPHSNSLMIVTVLGGVLAMTFALLADRYLKKFVLRFAAVGVVVGILLGVLLISAMGLPSVTLVEWMRSLSYMSVMVAGAVMFSIFWVSTAGMDAKSVAEQFKSTFLSLPGFRRDPRIIETVLERYIPSLTVLGGAFIGILAGFADMTNALGTGTGILLTVMIVYQMYEQIIQQHSEDMPPMLKKFFRIA